MWLRCASSAEARVGTGNGREEGCTFGCAGTWAAFATLGTSSCELRTFCASGHAAIGDLLGRGLSRRLADSGISGGTGNAPGHMHDMIHRKNSAA